jgi:hypothetical protein
MHSAKELICRDAVPSVAVDVVMCGRPPPAVLKKKATQKLAHSSQPLALKPA